MIALAVALVLCCAMVCGTYLTKRRYDVREEEARAVIVTGGDLRGDVGRVGEECRSLRAEMEQLRASMALRSM